MSTPLISSASGMFSAYSSSDRDLRSRHDRRLRGARAARSAGRGGRRRDHRSAGRCGSGQPRSCAAAGESAPAQTPFDQILDYLTVFGLLLFPLGAVLVVWAAFVQRGQTIGTRQTGWKSTLRTVVTVAVVLTLVVVVVRQLSERGWRPRSGPDATQTAPGTGTGGSQQPRSRDSADDPGWLPFLVVGSVVFAFGVALVGTAVVTRRRRNGLLPRAGAAAVVAGALGDMIAELRAERDPRRAVIRAYSGMERTLGARGLPRHAYEAPFEYLERILTGVQASAHSVGTADEPLRAGALQRARRSTPR